MSGTDKVVAKAIGNQFGIQTIDEFLSGSSSVPWLIDGWIQENCLMMVHGPPTTVGCEWSAADLYTIICSAGFSTSLSCRTFTLKGHPFLLLPEMLCIGGHWDR